MRVPRERKTTLLETGGGRRPRAREKAVLAAEPASSQAGEVVESGVQFSRPGLGAAVWL